MKSGFLYRKHTPYEWVFNSFPIQTILGLVAILLLPATYLWGCCFWQTLSTAQLNSLIIVTTSFIAVSFILKRLMRYPGEHAAAYIIPATLVIAGISASIILTTRIHYSNTLLITSLSLSLVWFFGEYFVSRNKRRLTLGIIPFGQTCSLNETTSTRFITISTPKLSTKNFDAIVADLHSSDLCPEWEKFLAQCTLNRIPVYNVKQIKESLTGRVKIDHLSENEFGTLLPSPFYESVKRIMDIALVMLSLPFWLPIIGLFIILIKRETPGPALFIQERVGQGNKTFALYKLRSMTVDSEKSGPQFAKENDYRITGVGKFIRKTRIDELPQFINVLKGDMSLIGPRPEQEAFVKKFETEIPFYIYRHSVKPGITGWAQVMHGYAANAEDTRVKIEHDFYYLKHFSLWLDILIVFKTVKTILTGFGSR